jgi:hypothetical protein
VSARLPRVICSSVIRSVHQGESHGGVYLVDLEDGTVEQVVDWSDPGIDWEGRGGDRGLRGIAFHQGLVYLAASDEIFVYDRSFRRLGSITNRYLHLCHEISIRGDRLFLASTGFDSVLEYDLAAGRFVRGTTLRYARIWRLRRTLGVRVRPSFRRFDPEQSGGPTPGDTSHVNQAFVHDGGLFTCGTKLAGLWRIDDERPTRHAIVPFGTHNTRPFRDGVLFNHTRTDRICYADRRGRVLRSVPLPTYPTDELLHADLSRDLARPAFGRGLTELGDGLIVGGCSPATVSVYDIDKESVVTSVTITKDVRNAIHGLEVWPYD